MPACPLVSERFEGGRYFRPANRIGHEMDSVFLALLTQVPVHACHQVQVFANRSTPKTSKLFAQVGSKNTKSSGNDQQHVKGVPPFPADQKSAQVLLHLHHLQKSPG